MDIKHFCVGPLGANCYLLTDNGDGAVIDPGGDAELILAAIKNSGATLTKILLTHGHFDHTGAVRSIAKASGAKVYIHSSDGEMLTDNDKNLSFMGSEIDTYPADIYFDDSENITVGNSTLKVYHTPGHSEGSVCFLWGDNLFTGDLLFKGSIGRFDFGDLKAELNSLKFLMETIGDTIKVYPGHGESTSIGEERRTNPYILNHIL